jgi:hypothetical protein
MTSMPLSPRPSGHRRHHRRYAACKRERVEFASGDVRLAIDHPAYAEEIELLPDSIDELPRDLRPDPSEKG